MTSQSIFEQVKQVIRDRRDGSSIDITDEELDALDEDYVWSFIGKAITEIEDDICDRRES